MNEIQDIILESEYNVLIALSEYYDKQLILESYYMEATSGISPAAAPDIIQRFINWCLKMVANIQNKSSKIPPKTPVPPTIAPQSQTVVQAANQFSQSANNDKLSPDQVSQQMQSIDTQVNSVQFDQQQSQQQTTADPNAPTVTIDQVRQSIEQVKQTINKIDNDVKQMEAAAANAQSATQDQTKLKAEKEKLKTGGGILKKLNNLITTMTTPVTSIEGEPTPNLKAYGQQVINSIKNATNEQEIQNIYDKAEHTFQNAQGWYNNKITGPEAQSLSKKEIDYCKSQLTMLQQWWNGVKQVQADRIQQLTNQDPSNQPTVPNIVPNDFKAKMIAQYAGVKNKPEADNIYKTLKDELRKAYDWYTSRINEPNVSQALKNQYNTQIKSIESLQKTNKILYKDVISHLHPLQANTQPRAQKVSPEAQNIMNQINS